MPAKTGIVPLERIESAILVVRGQKVLLDRDLALLYGVETRALNEAVRRNINRFPLRESGQAVPLPCKLRRVRY